MSSCRQQKKSAMAKVRRLISGISVLPGGDVEIHLPARTRPICITAGELPSIRALLALLDRRPIDIDGVPPICTARRT